MCELPLAEAERSVDRIVEELGLPDTPAPVSPTWTAIRPRRRSPTYDADNEMTGAADSFATLTFTYNNDGELLTAATSGPGSGIKAMHDDPAKDEMGASALSTFKDLKLHLGLLESMIDARSTDGVLDPLDPDPLKDAKLRIAFLEDIVDWQRMLMIASQKCAENLEKQASREAELLNGLPEASEEYRLQVAEYNFHREYRKRFLDLITSTESAIRGISG